MMQWLVPVIILVLAVWLVPMSVRSTKRSRRGRSGGVLASFAEGLATALDPSRRLIVEEMEKRQEMDGEEADGDDKPLLGIRGA
jgi:hypothetical protein